MSRMAPTAETDETLFQRVRAGDETAFLTLYRRRQTAIYRFALHMTGSFSAAEDVTQEVFLALIGVNCGYDPERGTLSGYLYGIARKLVLRHFERSRSVTESDRQRDEWVLPDAVSAADPMVDLLREEGIEELRRAVLSLPQRYREVVVLCDLEETDYSDAALILACPIGTIRSRLHRARALLLEKLSLKQEPHSRVTTLKPARSLT